MAHCVYSLIWFLDKQFDSWQSQMNPWVSSASHLWIYKEIWLKWMVDVFSMNRSSTAVTMSTSVDKQTYLLLCCFEFQIDTEGNDSLCMWHVEQKKTGAFKHPSTDCQIRMSSFFCILEPPPQTQHLCLQCLVICLMQCCAEVLPRDLHCARSNDCIKIGQHYATHAAYATKTVDQETSLYSLFMPSKPINGLQPG